LHIHDLVGSAEELEQAIQDGFVKVVEHPLHPRKLYNYTQRAQFDNAWNSATMACRGVIVNAGGIVVARPFRKFFNLSQLPCVPDGPFTVQEKVDGSLGIGYLTPTGGVAIATRGSFSSDQATWATCWVNATPEYAEFVRDQILSGSTPLFEIVYPQNRIVVDYGQTSGLVYLASISIETGEDVGMQGRWPGQVAPYYEGLDLETLIHMERSNAEGFVLKWPCGTRAKVKHEEYVRLHRILTNVSSKTIWELLKAHQSVDQLIDMVPDEFYEWVRLVMKELNEAFSSVESEALAVLAQVPADASRKEQAEFILAEAKTPGIVFAMLDGKMYADKIWDLVRPVHSKPFRTDTEIC
jgi:RNA ligase